MLEVTVRRFMGRYWQPPHRAPSVYAAVCRSFRLRATGTQTAGIELFPEGTVMARWQKEQGGHRGRGRGDTDQPPHRDHAARPPTPHTTPPPNMTDHVAEADVADMVAEMPVAEAVAVCEEIAGSEGAWSEAGDPELQAILFQQLADMSDVSGGSDRGTPVELWFGGAALGSPLI